MTMYQDNPPDSDLELLSAWFDEELSEDEQQLLRTQFGDQVDELPQLVEYRLIHDLMLDLPREAAPASLIEEIRQQIQPASHSSSQTTKPSRTAFWKQSRWLVGTTLTFLFICGITYLNWGPVSEQSMDEMDEAVMVAHQPASNSGHEESFGLIVQTERLLDEQTKLPELVLVDKTAGIYRSERPFSNVDSRQDDNPDAAHHENQPSTMATTLTVRDQPLTQAVPEPMAEIPAPPVLPDLEAEVLAKLNLSKKLPQPLEAGDLVNLVQNQQHEVSLVELSVVDIHQTCGQVQMLLVEHANTANGLPAEQDGLSTDIVDRYDVVWETEPSPVAVPEELTAEKEELSRALSRRRPTSDDGMIAIYVEAPAADLLASLSQLSELEQVQTIHFHDSPNLTHHSYALVPAEDESINPQVLSRMDRPIPKQRIVETPAQENHSSEQKEFGRKLETRSQEVVAPGSQAVPSVTQELYVSNFSRRVRLILSEPASGMQQEHRLDNKQLPVDSLMIPEPTTEPRAPAKFFAYRGIAQQTRSTFDKLLSNSLMNYEQTSPRLKFYQSPMLLIPIPEEEALHSKPDVDFQQGITSRAGKPSGANDDLFSDSILPQIAESGGNGLPRSRILIILSRRESP